MVVEEAAEQLAIAEEQSQLTEEEVDSLKTQLADYQQALDMQADTCAAISTSITSIRKGAPAIW